MTREEILQQYYESIEFARDNKKDGWTRPFNAEEYRGAKLLRDLVDANTGEVVAPAGRKLTKRGAKKLADDGVKSVLISNEEMAERFAAEDVVNVSRLKMWSTHQRAKSTLKRVMSFLWKSWSKSLKLRSKIFLF